MEIKSIPCFWFTGLSGSGKTTLATHLKSILFISGITSTILDGDEIRKNICADLGFSDKDRLENVRRVSHIANLIAESNSIPLVALISPFQDHRNEARKIFKGKFVEIFVDCPIDVCQMRDPKGLYKQVNDGKIKNFTGINSSYEIPQNPDIHLKTNTLTMESSVDIILAYYKELKGKSYDR